MKISTKGRYALRLMVDIAMNSRGDWVTIKDISHRQDISEKYLEQIVNPLIKAGLLLSSRGPQGGYMLSKMPSQYTAGEILRAIEGNLAPVACLESETNTCARSSICPTLSFWKGLQNVIDDYVDSVTLQDLIQRSIDAYDFSI